MRGPFLAMLEFRRRLLQPESPALQDDGTFSGDPKLTLRHTLVSYFESFGKKPACHHDLASYFVTPLLELDGGGDVISVIWDTCVCVCVQVFVGL